MSKELAARMAALAGLAEAFNNDDDAEGTPPSMQARRLKDHYSDLTRKHTFECGQLVQLKKGLEGNLKLPSPGHPAIVTKILDTPIIDKTVGNGNPDFGREFDVILMVLTSGRAIEFTFDSRFFEPYSGEID
jgi:hypothetical protein